MYFCSPVRTLSMSNAVKLLGSVEVCLFIYGLFYDAHSSSDCVVLNDRIMSE